MSASLAELLAPQIRLDVISRIRKGRGPLGSWLGFQPNKFDPETVSVSGPNTVDGTGSVRNFSYSIFDHTRVVLKARAPGAGPATVAANPVAVNQASVARYHQKVILLYELLGNLSNMAGPSSQIDKGGEDYIARQTMFLAEQANNMIEMMAAGMMRDSLYFIQAGDDWLPSFTAPTGTQVGFQVPFKIPTGNTGQLNMLGTGNIITIPWNNPGATIIGDLSAIIAAYKQLSRYSMTDTWINNLMWVNIITNTQVRNTAGSSNTPFAEFKMDIEKGMSASGREGDYSAIIKGQPHVRWHFCDDTLALNTDIDPSYSTAPSSATLAKEVPDNMVIFTTEPGPDWCRLHLGGEYVCEQDGMEGQLRTGWYFWHQYKTQPSVVELLCLLNCAALLFVPSVVAPATTVF